MHLADARKPGEDYHFPLAPRPQFDGGASSGSLVIESGPGITLWSGQGTTGETASETKFQLLPDQHAIIGRQEGGQIEYLDPRFRPTQMVPQTGQSVLTQNGYGQDTFVSRGHFALRGSERGIVLVNGVPRRGGGIRPPVNGTWMLSPARRFLGAGEEFLIEPGIAVWIQLPNSTIISIKADGTA